MEINILEHPKSKSCFEEEIAIKKLELSKMPFIALSGETIVFGITSAFIFALSAFLLFEVYAFAGFMSGLLGSLFLFISIETGRKNRIGINRFIGTQIQFLSETAPGDCLKIEQWLVNEDIKSFINKVVTLESRKLRNCEADAMKSFFEQSLVDKYDFEQQGKIDAACERIYIKPILNPA